MALQYHNDSFLKYSKMDSQGKPHGSDWSGAEEWHSAKILNFPQGWPAPVPAPEMKFSSGRGLFVAFAMCKVQAVKAEFGFLSP